MGILNKMMGMGGAKSDAKKEEIRKIFNSTVDDGNSYAVYGVLPKSFFTIMIATRCFFVVD